MKGTMLRASLFRTDEYDIRYCLGNLRGGWLLNRRSREEICKLDCGRASWRNTLLLEVTTFRSSSLRLSRESFDYGVPLR